MCVCVCDVSRLLAPLSINLTPNHTMLRLALPSINLTLPPITHHVRIVVV